MVRVGVGADADRLARAQGCLLGQLAGDALGSLVEFQSPEEILREYPDGVRELADGGTWNTIAGQPTDDSEMALALARSLAEHGAFDQEAVRRAYVDWLDSDPFDRGGTVTSGLRGFPNSGSQANGALMRVSPIGIAGANRALEVVADWARKDAELTHPHPVCVQANELFAMAVAHAIQRGLDGATLYAQVVEWARERDVGSSLMQVIIDAAEAPPADYCRQQGWVLIAFQNALWQLLHADNFEEGVVDTVMRGGDTDTNAAICGALLGAVNGLPAIPNQWKVAVLNCRPAPSSPRVCHPRPQRYWPTDALELAERLLRNSC